MADQATELNHLFELIHKGDKTAFDALFHAFYPRLLKFATSYLHSNDAEEVVSEVFVKLWLRRNELDRIHSPKVYLYVAAKNGSLNKIRQDSKSAHQFLETEHLAAEIPETGSSPEQMLLNTHLEKLISKAVNGLPEQRRLIFKMVKEEGLKCREVAEILELSVRTVEGQLFKAVHSIAHEIESYLGYNPASVTRRKGKLSVFLFF
ncbi:MAG: RNA polymerase sigma-70 factor [Pedobacter sp.]|nr:MAG: RNA polymerase sigma-70 factor [Pedobacter sp.]